jgi:hypothetical protein
MMCGCRVCGADNVLGAVVVVVVALVGGGDDGFALPQPASDAIPNAPAASTIPAR